MIASLNLNPPGKMSTAGGTTQVIRKRADDMELFNALKTIKITEPIRHEMTGTVYPLERHIDGWPAVVKIINREEHGRFKVDRERRNLYNVQRLLGSARTHDAKYYYFIMPLSMGIPYSQARDMSPSFSQKEAERLMLGAVTHHEQQHCIKYL